MVEKERYSAIYSIELLDKYIAEYYGGQRVKRVDCQINCMTLCILLGGWSTRCTASYSSG